VARARIHDRAAFQVFLRDLFTQRRKLLRGVVAQIFKGQLAKSAIDLILTDLKLSPDARAEELEVEQLVALSNRLQQQIHRETLETNDKEHDGND